MPISTALDKSRAQVTDPLSARELRKLAKDATIRVLQASEPLSTKSWKLIDDIVLAERPDIQLRVYGFYSGGCDLSFVSGLANVRHFAADCLQDAENVEKIGNLVPKQANTDAFDAHEKMAKVTISLRAASPFARSA